MSYIDQSDYKRLLNKFAQGTQKQKLQENYVDLMPINSLQETKPTEMGFLNAQGSQKYADAMYEVEVDNSTEDTGVDNSKKIFVKQKDDYILLTLLRDLAKQFGHSGAKVLSLAVKFGASPELLTKLKNEFGQDASSEVKEAGDVGMNSIKNGFDKNPKVTKADFIPAKKNEGLYGDGPHTTGYQLENLSLEEKKELKDYVDSIKITKKAIQELLAKAKAPKMEGGDTTDQPIPPAQATQTPTEEPIQENEGTDSNEYISSIENNKPIFIYKVNDKGHKEPVPVTKDMLVSIERDYRENFPGNPSEFARERDMPVEYIGKILTAGRYFNPDYKQKSATPGGRYRANFDNMRTKPHQGPNVGPKGFDY